MQKKNVVIGFLGTQLDAGQGGPLVEMAAHGIAGPARGHADRPAGAVLSTRHQALARLVEQDIANLSPDTVVNLIPMDFADPWDFGEMYAALYDWTRGYRFDPEREQYWAHITTGTHVAQICMFLMVESRTIPGVLLQTSLPGSRRARIPASTLIDLDLSRYDVLARRFSQARTTRWNSSRVAFPRATGPSTG